MGNVWEYCQDNLAADSEEVVTRGWSFRGSGPEAPNANFRRGCEKTFRGDDTGFRVVLRGPVEQIKLKEQIYPTKMENPIKKGTDDRNAASTLLIDRDQDEGKVHLEFKVTSLDFRAAVLRLRTADVNAAETSGRIAVLFEDAVVGIQKGAPRDSVVHIPLVVDKLKEDRGILHLKVILYDTTNGSYLEKRGQDRPSLNLY